MVDEASLVFGCPSFVSSYSIFIYIKIWLQIVYLVAMKRQLVREQGLEINYSHGCLDF